MTDRLYTVQETAEALGSSQSSVSHMIKAGRFPHARKTRRGWLIPLSDVVQVQREGNQPAFPQAPVGWMTVQEVVDALGVTAPRVYGWLWRRNVIPSVDGAPGAVKDERGRWAISGEALRRIPRHAVETGQKLGGWRTWRRAKGDGKAE